MKRPVVPTVAALLLGICAALLSTCSTYGPNRLHVLIDKGAILAPMVGHKAYCTLFEVGAPPGTGVIGCADLQKNVIPADDSLLIPILSIPNPSGHDLWEGTPGGTYELEVWVDLNDNKGTVDVPESGIDYVTSPARLDVVLDASPDGTAFVISQFVRAP